MEWKKLGKVFQVNGEGGWMHSHAQIPAALVLEDRIRVYFATRPQRNLSLTTFVDVDRNDPTKVIALNEQPVLQPGPAGAFDEHGIMPSCVIKNGKQVWLYYGGWSRRENIRYSNWTGIAVSDDDGATFRRMFPGPVVDRTPNEIYSATAVFVLPEGERMHMWYARGLGWFEVNGQLEEVYRLRYGHSTDGIHWTRPDQELVPWLREHEPTHRPTVIKLGDRYHMWFCHRGIADFRGGDQAYRMGYAWSDDARTWHRDDAQAGLTVSPGQWDSDMVAYPYVVKVDDRVLMFYNGNGFGVSGFGVAELVR